ncbi:MAG TPA: GNAT family N-acetyltransferase [Ktedonobacterales bacterium]|jgi:ribosomal-protein-alanine N-acetyltransferase|nr:GNAT family N-acetyltransferase [Ktedonobacterales bacterium]
MRFTAMPMTTDDARAVQTWRYKGEYTTYNFADTAEGMAELLDTRSPYFAVRNERGELVGFFAYGTAGEVGGEMGETEPALYADPADRTLSVGLGLRPDLTGKGLGLAFVEAALAFARERFAPHGFRMFVLDWNTRAIRVYERAGFARVRALTVTNRHGTLSFVEMRRGV